MATTNKPALLLILDGWGHRESQKDNAIANANTPTWDKLTHNFPNTLVSTSGMDVGLPDGQMGNSEVGHMSLGSGRIVYQSISRINKSIADGDFYSNTTYCEAIDKAVETNNAIHITGLLSPGGVHSHQDHLFAMIKCAAQRGAKKIFVHPILDGRDTPPRSAEAFLEKLQHCCDTYGASIASLIGRFFAMDRDNRWDRIEKAYNLIVKGEADYSSSNALSALQEAYQRDENDEFVKPTAIEGSEGISDGDTVIFMNFRADRARELTQAFIDPTFNGFDRGEKVHLSAFVMTTEYADSFDTACAFPPESLHNGLGEYLESLGKSQLRIAETEKYAHVTFFFSGGREKLYNGEERILVPSPDVETYDLKPEMSAPEVTDKLVEAIKSSQYDCIVCNIANGDMVGHTGVYEAAIKACEAVDRCLEKITQAIIEVDGQCLITADHGNCEQMHDYDSNQPHTQHTTELVPLIYVGNSQLSFQEKPGQLADIAPSLLDLMGLPAPQEMTGHSLIVRK